MEDKNKKKQIFKQYAITIGIIYILSLYFIAQYCAYKVLYPHANFINVFNYTMEGIMSEPFTLPEVPSGFFLAASCITIIFLLLSAYIYTVIKRDQHARFGTENGTAKWNTDLDKWNKTYSDPINNTCHDGHRNMILTQDIYMSMDTRQTRRNNNVIVIGGSGAGKSRFFVKPNLCEMPLNVNFVCTDPSGELLAETGSMLEDAGFKIKVFNLVNMSESDRYNPLNYINTENDVILLVDCILANTTDPNKKGGDDFWEKAQKLMFQAFIYLIWEHGTELRLEKNLLTLVQLMEGCEISESESSTESQGGKTAKYFKAVEETGWYFDADGVFTLGKPDSSAFTYYEPFGKKDICVKQYNKFMTGAGKTLKSILISAEARLSTLDSNDITDLLSHDELELDKVGDEKTALFVIIPQEHDSFNFLAAMLYTQLFQTLYYHAENECQGNYIVEDSKGEHVKIFPIPRVIEKKKIFESDEEIDFDLENVKDESDNENKENNNKSVSIFQKLFQKLFSTKKVTSKNTEDEIPNNSTDAKFDEIDRTDTIPDESANPNQETENKVIDFCERLKQIKCTKKGNMYLLKVPTGQKDDNGEDEYETIGEYSNVIFAKDKFNAIKNGCTYKQCGLFLPYHVRFLLDEFANIGQIPSFTKKLATMRKYEISATVILQNLAQIKNMYKDDWGSILGNCDSFLFLGCPELDTLKYVSEMLGKQTIVVRDNSVSRGGKRSTSLSYKKIARELATPDELFRMDNSECIYILRGQQPFKSKKHQFDNHINYKYTADANINNLYKFQKKEVKKFEYVSQDDIVSSLRESQKDNEKRNADNHIASQAHNKDVNNKVQNYTNNKDINGSEYFNEMTENELSHLVNLSSSDSSEYIPENMMSAYAESSVPYESRPLDTTESQSSSSSYERFSASSEKAS